MPLAACGPGGGVGGYILQMHVSINWSIVFLCIYNKGLETTVTFNLLPIVIRTAEFNRIYFRKVKMVLTIVIRMTFRCF